MRTPWTLGLGANKATLLLANQRHGTASLACWFLCSRCGKACNLRRTPPDAHSPQPPFLRVPSTRGQVTRCQVATQASASTGSTGGSGFATVASSSMSAGGPHLMWHKWQHTWPLCHPVVACQYALTCCCPSFTNHASNIHGISPAHAVAVHTLPTVVVQIRVKFAGF